VWKVLLAATCSTSNSLQTYFIYYLLLVGRVPELDRGQNRAGAGTGPGPEPDRNRADRTGAGPGPGPEPGGLGGPDRGRNRTGAGTGPGPEPDRARNHADLSGLSKELPNVIHLDTLQQ